MPPPADLHLKPAVLARYGLPDIAYPIAQADLQRALATGGRFAMDAEQTKDWIVGRIVQ